MKRLWPGIIGLWSLIVFSLAAATGAYADRRVALVVGNAKYQNINKLENPVNDAPDIAEALRKLDFDVIVRTDADKGGFDRALAEFARKAQGADAALFYYAGHGIQYQRQNYLLPIDIEVQDYNDVEFQAVSVNRVMTALERTNGVKIVILDACRDNPLDKQLTASTRSLAGATRGLARVDRTEGLVVAYATAPDQVAQDGVGRNSPFTESLIRRLKEPGLEIATLFRRVTQDVYERTNGRQRPEVSISLLNDYYLNMGVSDSLEWARVRESIDPADFQKFIQQFPRSPFAREAQYRIDLFARLQRENMERVARAQDQEQAERDRVRREQIEKEAQALEAQRRELERMQAEANAKELERQAAAKRDAERMAAERRDFAARQEAARQETARQEAERLEAQKREAMKQEVARLAIQKRLEADRLAKEKQEADRLVAEQAMRLAAQQDAERRAAEQKLADQKLADQKLADQKAAEQKVAEQRAAEQRAAEQKAAELKAAELKAAEQKLAEQKAAEQREADRRETARLAIQKRLELEAAQKAAELKATEQRAMEQKLAEEKAAAQRAAEQKLAEQKAAEQREADRRQVALLAVQKRLAMEAEQKVAEQKAAEQRAYEQEQQREADRQAVARLAIQRRLEQEQRQLETPKQEAALVDPGAGGVLARNVVANPVADPREVARAAAERREQEQVDAEARELQRLIEERKTAIGREAERIDAAIRELDRRAVVRLAAQHRREAKQMAESQKLEEQRARMGGNGPVGLALPSPK